jgi:hypothetical protein
MLQQQQQVQQLPQAAAIVQRTTAAAKQHSYGTCAAKNKRLTQHNTAQHSGQGNNA